MSTKREPFSSISVISRGHVDELIVGLRTAVDHCEVLFFCRNGLVSGPVEVMGLAGEEVGKLV